MPYFHELIDYDYGVVNRRDDRAQGSLVHILFTEEDQMRRYLQAQAAGRTVRLAASYIYREWGIDALTKLSVIMPEQR